jgi:hypothetical protein
MQTWSILRDSYTSMWAPNTVITLTYAPYDHMKDTTNTKSWPLTVCKVYYLLRLWTACNQTIIFILKLYCSTETRSSPSSLVLKLTALAASIRYATPFYVKSRRRNIRRTQQKVTYCYKGQLVSTQLWFVIIRSAIKIRINKNWV